MSTHSLRRALSRKTCAGFTLLDLIIILAILGFVFAAGYPPFIRSTSRLRLDLASHQIAGALRLARTYAVRHSANVAVKFRTEDDGTVTYALYRDGDGDGVLNKDIESGKDPEVWAPRRLNYLNEDIQVGLPQEGRPPRHPGNPRRRLDRLEDPIRYNRSDLASFSPIGRATPGSIYLIDKYGHLMVVRTFHLTGKVTILSYDYKTEVWK